MNIMLFIMIINELMYLLILMEYVNLQTLEDHNAYTKDLPLLILKVEG